MQARKAIIQTGDPARCGRASAAPAKLLLADWGIV
jgi:hypothetical protein